MLASVEALSIIIEINGTSDEESYNIRAQVTVEDALIRMLKSSVKDQSQKVFITEILD